MKKVPRGKWESEGQQLASHAHRQRRQQMHKSRIKFLEIFTFLSNICAILTMDKECGTGTTTYLRTEGALLSANLSIAQKHSLEALDGIPLQDCAKKCTEQSQCRSFEFHSEQLHCRLLSLDSQPIGPGILKSNHNSSAHFQRVCVPVDAKLLCPSSHAFERFPQHILSGHAMEVLAVSSVDECLAACLDAPRRFGTECRSTMYFYERGQCLLNREHRGSLPNGVFRQEKGAELVDYFDNVCANVECQDGAQLHWLQTEHFKIDPSRELVLHGMSMEECKQICIDNRVHQIKFPCKAFVHSSASKQCQLSAESAILGPILKKRKKQRRHMKLDVRPIATTNSGSTEQIQLDSELASFSSGQYFEKICIQSEQLPKSNGCKEMASFELIPGKVLETKEKMILPLRSLAHCLWACLNANDCRSVQVQKDIDMCILSTGSQLTNPDAFNSNPRADYYEKLCQNDNNEESLSLDISPNAKQFGLASPTLGNANAVTSVRKQRPIMSHLNEEENDFWNSTVGHDSEDRATLDTDCRVSGIEVRAKFGTPSTGILFLRDHAATCSANFQKSIFAVRIIQNLQFSPFPSLAIPSPLSLPTDEAPKCPGKELGPRHWSFIIVLQHKLANQLEIDDNINDLHLLTGKERVFNVSCDFSETKTKFNSESTVIPSEEVATEGNRSISLEMALLHDGQPVSAVALGEELELRWTFQHGSRQQLELGMFVDSCIAERLDGDPPNPPPLALIVDGCPEPRVRAAHLMPVPISSRSDGGVETRLRVFRFDGSRRVRIRCAVDICVEQCPPANCTQPVEAAKELHPFDGLSFGRRRKRRKTMQQQEEEADVGLTTLGELAELVQRYDRLRSAAASESTEYEQKPMSRQNPGRPVGNGLLQQSTTISGSYTITDDDDHGLLQKGKVATERGNSRESLDLKGLLKSSRKRVNSEEDVAEVPIAFVGGKKKTKTGQQASDNANSACEENILASDASASSLCIGRPLAVLGIILFAVLVTLQAFQLAQFVRRQMAMRDKRVINKELDELDLPEPHPPPPCSAAASFEFDENGSGFRASRMRSSFCLQEEILCDCPPNFCQCAAIGNGQLEERNRRQSFVSVGPSVIIKPTPHPRQTVFPAHQHQNTGQRSTRWEQVSF